VTIGANNFELFDVSIKNPDGSYLVNPFAVGNGGATIPTTTMTQAGNYVLLVDGRNFTTGSVPITLNDQGFGLAPTQRQILAGPGLRAEAKDSRLSAPVAQPRTNAAAPFANGDDDTWIPGSGNTHGDWRSHRSPSAAERVPRLLAGKGVTALSGLVLDLGGNPLTGITLAIGDTSARTDSKGRFLIKDAASGRQILEIDGSTSDRRGKTYGLFEFSVDVAPGVTTVMPRVIWLPRIDTQHTVAITAPTTKEIVVTTPYIKGLELHIPKGTTITDEDGEPVTELSITPIPVDRTPFPLPDYVEVPVYFTIQPGGAYVDKKNAWLVYPNYPDFEPGSSHPFWHYDPEDKGWYVYGHGTVTDDGRQVVADKATRLYEFTGAMFGGNGQDPAGNGPEPGSDSDDGDPVDLGTGLFVLSKTDVILPATMPLTVTRTYRQLDSKPRPFGIGANWNFGLFLSTTAPGTYQVADLNLPDGGQIHYVRTSSGTGYSDAVFETTSSPTAFYKSQITWNGVGWTLRLRDGTKYIFHNEIAPLSRIEDRFGNSITLSRDTLNSINITQATSSDGRWVKFGYDGSNRVTSATDNTGRVTGYQYNAAGYLWKVTDPKIGVTTYTYDASNRMWTLQDARLITFLTNEYWPDGKVKKQTQADSTTYQFAYSIDGNGKVTQTDVTDPRGIVHRVTFNAAGYPVTDTRALGTSEVQTTTLVRQASGHLPTSATDHLGRRTDLGYDSQGSPSSITNLAGTSEAVTRSTSYAAPFELVASVTDPLEHTTTFDYDSQGRLSSITDPRQKSTTFTSNASGQPLTITDPTNKTTSFEYAFGDLIKTTNPLGVSAKRFVDGAGRVLAMTDGLGNLARTEYDVLNRPTKITDPMAGLTQFTYDANGNVLTVSDPRNGVTTYTYDSMDRTATHKDALLRTESFVYDANGNLTKVTDRNALVTTYQYDSLNRRTFAGFKTQGTPPNVTYESTIAYTYDAVSRLRVAADSGAGTLTFGFDDLDRLTSESAPQGSISYAYDDANRRTSMTLAGQPQVTYVYDDADRLTAVTQGPSTVAVSYDDAGRQLTVTLPNGVVGTYTYDAASQIKTINYATASSTVGDLSYSYDSAGRRAIVGGSLAQIALPAAVSTTTYNANNQLTKWNSNAIRPTYDANGSMVADGTYTYTWNARNQLIQLKQGNTVVGTFAYDAVGRRVSKTVSGSTTGFAYDGSNFVQEKNGSGTPIANLLTGQIDHTLSRTDSSGARYFLTDALGSTVAITDSAGAIQTTYTYEPYGKTSVSGPANSNSQRFTGREDDGPLYFYRARYYHPTFGRFISEDPTSFAAGDTNLYRYVGGDPTNQTDPSGQIAPFVAACLGGAAFSVVVDVVANILGQRKTTLGDVVGSAALGCASGLAVFGLGKVLGKFLGAATNGFGGLSQAGRYGVWPYNTLRADIKYLGLNAHHLLEKRFAAILGQKASKMASVAVTKEEHQAFTNAWNAAIPHGTTSTASYQDIMNAAKEIYANYPEILKALGL
jgi:RHS repeat-associated protein